MEWNLRPLKVALITIEITDAHHWMLATLSIVNNFEAVSVYKETMKQKNKNVK
jgi:hypothetical protein